MLVGKGCELSSFRYLSKCFYVKLCGEVYQMFPLWLRIFLKIFHQFSQIKTS